MPYPTSAISAGDQATVRGGGVTLRYVAIHTGSVMLQFNPNANASSASNAQIPYTTALAGSDANVLPGMTVLITPSSDYVADLKNRAEDCLITYVRDSGATSSTLDIGETSYQWVTGDTVTVLDDWRVHRRKTRVVGSTITKDYDEAYRTPKPRIYDLTSAVVIASGATADVSPTPSAEAMESGETISSWSWQVIENGALTHTSTSPTPTFTLDVGTAWLHLTVTDSAGITNWLAVLIAVVPDTFDSVVHQAIAGGLEYDLDSGNSGAIEALGDVTTLVPGSPLIIFAYHWYADSSSALQVEFVGWLAGSANQIAVTEQSGQELTYTADLEGLAAGLDGVRVPGFPANEVLSPAAWGQFARLTPFDSLWYALSEHSTVANVAALDLPSNHANYRFPQVDVPSGSLLALAHTLSFRADCHGLNWAPTGELVIRQDLNYAATAARTAALVYATYSTADGPWQVTRPPAGRFAFAAIRAGCASYNTSNRRPVVINTQAPGGFVPGVLQEEVDGIILTKDLAVGAAGSRAGLIAGNHFFASNESVGVQGEIQPGYNAWPSNFQWHKADLPATELLDGQVLDTATRHLCVRAARRFDPDTGAIDLSLTLREETGDYSDYMPNIVWVPTATQQPTPTMPVDSGYEKFSDYDDYGDDYYPGDHEDDRSGWQDDSLGPEEAAEEAQPEPNTLEVVKVPLKGGSVSSSTVTEADKTYRLKIAGFGRLTEDNWTVTFDFEQNDGGWDETGTTPEYSNGAIDHGDYVQGTGWVHTDSITRNGSSTYARRAKLYIEYDNTGVDITDVELVFNLVKGSYPLGSSVVARIQEDITVYPTTESNLVALTNNDSSSGSGQILTYSGSTSSGRLFVDVIANGGESDPADLNGAATIKRVVATGTGPNPFASGTYAGTLGDAFYQGFEDEGTPTAYATGKGLQIDSADPSPRPAYEASHVYEYSFAGTGSAITFEFVDPDADYSDNENKHIRIELIEEGQ